jgi:hypothetical protein
MNVRAIFLGTAVCARYPRDSANNYPDQYLSQQQLLGSSASSNGPAGGGAGGPTSPPATSPTAQGSAGRQAAAAGLFPGIALPPLAMSAAKDEQTEVRLDSVLAGQNDVLLLFSTKPVQENNHLEHCHWLRPIPMRCILFT